MDELRNALGTVEVNMVTNLVDPYCVAMATKTKVVSDMQHVLRCPVICHLRQSFLFSCFLSGRELNFYYFVLNSSGACCDDCVTAVADNGHDREGLVTSSACN